MPTNQTALTGIARQHLGFETLETRSRDCLDFQTVSVWNVKAALEAAFLAGAQQAADELATVKTAA